MNHWELPNSAGRGWDLCFQVTTLMMVKITCKSSKRPHPDSVTKMYRKDNSGLVWDSGSGTSKGGIRLRGPQVVTGWEWDESERVL